MKSSPELERQSRWTNGSHGRGPETSSQLNSCSLGQQILHTHSVLGLLLGFQMCANQCAPYWGLRASLLETDFPAISGLEDARHRYLGRRACNLHQVLKMSLKPVVWPHVEKALAIEDVRGRPPTWAIWYTPSQGQLSSQKVPNGI